jgi:chromosome partitioning protein
MIVTLASSKGGVGKSTLAVNLATEWTSRGRRVVVLDADPQGTATAWGEVRAASGLAKPTVLAVGDNVRQVVLEISRDWDVVIIDTAGRQSKRLASALIVSDLALMPATPAGPDIWAMQASLDTVSEVQELRPELKAAIVVNGEQRTKLSAQARQALDELGVPVIGSLARRTAIAEAVTAGQGVVERDPRGSGAAEIRAVTDAIDAFVQGVANVA